MPISMPLGTWVSQLQTGLPHKHPPPHTHTHTHTHTSRDACGNWQGICGPFCNDDTNERGLRLLEFAICWRTHLVITKHPEDGHGIAQMDNTTTRLITF